MQALRDPSSITPRQRQVIQLIAEGLSNEELGLELGISPRTAKAHCDVLRQKLGVPRRRQIPLAYRLSTGDDPLANASSWREPTTGANGPAPAVGFAGRGRGMSSVVSLYGSQGQG